MIRRSLFALGVLLLLLPAPVYAQVAHDACSESHTGVVGSTSEASFSWTHTPSGTPRGVLVYVFNIDGTTHEATSLTYDGEAVAAVSGGEATLSSTESGAVKAYFLGTGVNTGAVTVVVNRNNNGQMLYAIACTVTAGGDTEVHTAGIVTVSNASIDLTEQAVTDGSPGTNSVRYGGVVDGLGAPPTPGTNSTAVHDLDIGNLTATFVRETTAGQGSRSVGPVNGGPPDEAVGVYLAVRQSGGGAVPCRRSLVGVGCE